MRSGHSKPMVAAIFRALGQTPLHNQIDGEEYPPALHQAGFWGVSRTPVQLNQVRTLPRR